jgi:hypothetical protein
VSSGVYLADVSPQKKRRDISPNERTKLWTPLAKYIQDVATLLRFNVEVKPLRATASLCSTRALSGPEVIE